jgi:hypothetical protein
MLNQYIVIAYDGEGEIVSRSAVYARNKTSAQTMTLDRSGSRVSCVTAALAKRSAAKVA